MKNLFITLLIGGLIASCIKVEPPAPVPNYSVYGILDDTEENIHVFIGRTFGIDELFSLDSLKHIPNAAVTITSNGVTKMLTLNTVTKEYETKNNGFLRSGQTYKLKAVIGDDVISAETTVPFAPQLRLVKGEVVGNSGQIRVAWNLPLNDNSTYYRLTGGVNFNEPFVPFFYWDAEYYLWQVEGKNVTASTVTSPLGNFDFGKYNNGEVTIELESLDQTWFDFKGKLDAVQNRTSFTKKFEAPIFFKSTIQNAVGVFGSTAKSSLTFNLSKL